MLIEYANLKYGYHKDGWDRAFRNRDIDTYRFRLLVNDNTIHSVLNEIYKIIAGLRRTGEPVTMLDIGCGTGHQISSVAYLCDKTVGFDVSSTVIDNNRRLNTATDFLVGDALNHPTFDETFNVVLMAGVLYSIDSQRSTHLRILNQALGSLSDNGFFVFYHRGYLSLIKYLDLKIKKWIDRFRGRTNSDYAMCYFDDGYIKSLCDEVGLRITWIGKSDFAFYMCNSLFSPILTKRSKPGWDSYANLNIFGKILYIISKYFIPFLCARSSIFILKKSNVK